MEFKISQAAANEQAPGATQASRPWTGTPQAIDAVRRANLDAAPSQFPGQPKGNGNR